MHIPFIDMNLSPSYNTAKSVVPVEQTNGENYSQSQKGRKFVVTQAGNKLNLYSHYVTLDTVASPKCSLCKFCSMDNLHLLCLCALTRSR